MINSSFQFIYSTGKSITLISLLFIINTNLLNTTDLKKHKWINRIIIVQSSQKLQSKYNDQMTEFSHSDEEFIERKLVLYQVVEDKYRMTDFINTDKKWAESKEMYENILDKKDEFKVILIGLDGRIKLETTDILTKVKLFAIIDSMPMRIDEMKENE